MGKKPKILVVGSFVMDQIVTTRVFPRQGQTILAERFNKAPGGKGANQAVQMARLGAQVTMCGKLGHDADGDEMRFVLYDAGENIAASGFIQLVQEYSADYFYNEHDGLAHHSWLDGSGTLQIDSLGAFTKASGDVPGENIGDTGDEALVGEWYQDGEAGAVSILVIYQTGIWDLYERPGGDGDPVMVDRGTLEGGSGGLYQAPSVVYDGVVYDMTVVSGDTLYWGGENDCYQKLT